MSEIPKPSVPKEEVASRPAADSYDAWARRKIERALKQADANPDDRIPQAEVWRRFGVEH